MEDLDWLARLPQLMARCSRQWCLELDDALEGGCIGSVHGCRGADGEDPVLKLSPRFANPAEEARALTHWGGNGAARLVAWDEEAGALLLERVRPGTFLMEREPLGHR